MAAFWMLATLASINAAVLFFMYLHFRRKISEALELDELLSKARREVGSLVAELNLAADRSVSLLEDRTAQAASAVEKVEKAILALERRDRGGDRERGIYDRLSRARPLTREAPVQMDSSPGAYAPPEADAPASRGLGAETGREEAALPEVKAIEDPVVTGKSPGEKALELWRQGFSAQIISRRTGMTLSEINLAIAMEEQRLLWNVDGQP